MLLFLQKTSLPMRQTALLFGFYWENKTNKNGLNSYMLYQTLKRQRKRKQ